MVEEINLLKKFSNPHIIRFIEAFENPGQVIQIYVIQRIHPKKNFCYDDPLYDPYVDYDQGGKSCAKARRAFAEKFGFGKFF